MTPSTVNLTLVALVLAVTALFVPSAGASRATVHDLRPLSAVPHPDACTPPGDIEGDTRIAVNPTNAKNIVASWNGFAPGGTVVSVSKDGGRTWKQVVVPGHAGCSLADADTFAADPGLGFDATGETLYVASLNRVVTLDQPERERVLVSRSTTGGETWESPKSVPGVSALPGLKESHLLWLAADPDVQDRAYMVWTAKTKADGDTAAFSQTTNGGESWSSAVTIYKPLVPHPEASNHVLRVLPDGTLLDVFGQKKEPGSPYQIVAIRCERDCAKGTESWSGPFAIGTACDSRPKDPDGDEVVTSPGPSLDVAGETAYVAWHSSGACTGHTTSELLAAKSTNGGRSWESLPPVVSGDGQPHEATLAVAPDGTVGVSYYDLRNDVPGDRELTTDVWFSHLHDASATWDEVHLAGPFNLRPLLGVTDFNGLTALPRSAGSNLPDLRIPNMRASDNRIRQGDKVTISATVANVGDADAASSTTEFVLDGSTVLGRVTVEPLPVGGFAASFVQALPANGADCVALGCTIEPPTDVFFARLKAGGSVEVGVNWDTRAVRGEHTIQAIADKDGAIAESDERNNAGALTVTVQGNKIKNESFERANESGTGPEGWTGSGTDAGTVQWTEVGSDGAMSASVTGSGGSALLAGSPAWISDPIVVAADETLTLRVSVSSIGASSAPTAGLVYLDALGQVISTDTLITAPLATEGFRMLESDVAVPADVVAVQVRLAGFSPLDGSASGRVAFDDVGLFGR